ncbi:MAG: S8 family serine peptidase [Anaerolineaceae bacterium]|nr:S8 family serine peptidase [Anaerolineaceae bacterium]
MGENDKEKTTSKLLDKFSSRNGIIILVIVSIVLLVIAGGGGWYLFKMQQEANSSIDLSKIEMPPSLSDLAEQYPEYSDVLSDPELEGIYKEYFVIYQEDGSEAAIEMARKRGLINERNEMKVTLELDIEATEELIEKIESLGIVVAASGGNLLDIIIPPSVIERVMNSDDPEKLFTDITELEHVKKVRLPKMMSPDRFKSGEESIDAIGAQAWHDAGITGQGVKVGVLDMGFLYYQSYLGSVLPDQVEARSFIYGVELENSSTEHGTACAEIIHTLAPDAELYFAAYQTDAEMFEAIAWLVDDVGVDVISNSTGSIIGSMDGTGPEAELVDLVASLGVLWVNSSGNNAESHYYGEFNGDENGYHQFEPGKNIMGVVPFTNQLRIALNWTDDWSGNASQDFSLILLDEEGEVLAVADEVQAGDGYSYPVEFVFSEVYAEELYILAIQSQGSVQQVTFNVHAFDALFEYAVPAYSVISPSDARGSLTVGATMYSNDELESYSSQGPTMDGRLKPEVTAPTGTSSEVYGGSFIGTSASCPHVAGAAALLFQVYGNSNDVRTIIEDRAVDLGPDGPDYAFGIGRLSMGAPDQIAEVETPAEEVPTTEIPTQEVVEQPETIIEEPEVVVENPEVPQFDSVNDAGMDQTILILGILCFCALGVFGFAGFVIIILVITRRR